MRFGDNVLIDLWIAVEIGPFVTVLSEVVFFLFEIIVTDRPGRLKPSLEIVDIGRLFSNYCLIFSCPFLHDLLSFVSAIHRQSSITRLGCSEGSKSFLHDKNGLRITCIAHINFIIMDDGSDAASTHVSNLPIAHL